MQVKKQQLEPDVEQWIGSKLGKECVKAVLSPRLFNLHAEHIRQNTRLDKSQARIKTSGRNINNLRYPDDTTLVAKSEEELKSLLMKVKEESENAGLKLNIQKAKIMLLLLSHFSRVRLCATPETAAHQASPSLGFSRQEHRSGLPFPSPRQESEK